MSDETVHCIGNTEIDPNNSYKNYIILLLLSYCLCGFFFI